MWKDFGSTLYVAVEFGLKIVLEIIAKKVHQRQPPSEMKLDSLDKKHI